MSDVGAAASANDKILCEIDKVMVHSIALHIKNNHGDTWTVERYSEEYPDAPLLSPYAMKVMADKKSRAGASTSPTPSTFSTGLIEQPGTFHEVFELGSATAAMSASGNPITVKVMSGHSQEDLTYLPAIDTSYIFNIDLLKKVIIGLELGMPTYLWGYHGSGKTTVLEQANARLKRPFVRVQHSLNMQESEVLGQWIVRNGATEFQLGPLPMAMLHGWTYCADEYDTAMPNVTTVYQPVLEGKALIIKDAPPEFRLITPHPNFRFQATGNTNGVGDETGLYQGTLMQNAANYSRFQITEEVKYMDKDIESAILCSRTGIQKRDANKIVKFANTVRTEFSEGRLSMTVSPRELISAAKLGIAYGGKWSMGIELAFANRLPRIDKAAVSEHLQRIFGDS